MNKTSIDWPGLTHTWNPVVGCERGCPYCYANDLHTKRHIAFKQGKLQNVTQYARPFNAMQFFPNRLLAPEKKRTPCKIFVGSMSDIAYWKPSWIRRIIKVCDNTPQHTYMFLTKSPLIYANYDFPGNCMLGITLTGTDDYMSSVYLYDRFFNSKTAGNTLFISIEPLLGELAHKIPNKIDLVIVGAETKNNKVVTIPEDSWLESIKVGTATQVHWKKNIRNFI